MIRQLSADPVLRRWIVDRLAKGKIPRRGLARRHPPYLAPLAATDDAPEGGETAFADLPQGDPRAALELRLAGIPLHLGYPLPTNPFGQTVADLEDFLALHRFAWLPAVAETIDPRWVNRLWQCWREAAGLSSRGWAWHPYTAAERAINILTYAGRHGLPTPQAETRRILVRHGDAILGNLEYFGEHGTGNHLANNGRGLYVIGLKLGVERFVAAGRDILLREAERIFAGSGILREGSSHYHLLLTRNYERSWRLAQKYQRPEADELGKIVGRAKSVLPALMLPGGLPLIGDISPDCPPDELVGRFEPSDFEGAGEWDADGWLRMAAGAWHGLWHVAPQGWPEMPGHAHQDCGSFELHHGTDRLFVDLGRGAYAEPDDAYCRAPAHNSLTVDGLDPYPDNKPYYDEQFRRRVGGGRAPRLARTGDGVELAFSGYRRVGGVGTVKRRWRFSVTEMVLEDTIDGSGQHRIQQNFHTILPVERRPDGVVLRSDAAEYRLAADAEVELSPTTCWTAYGLGRTATTIRIKHDAQLPWRATVSLTAA